MVILCQEYMRVLVAENDPQVVHTLRQALTISCYAVDVAESVPHTHELIRDNDYDLIILTAAPIHCDGQVLCAQIRSAQHTTPILVISPFNDSANCVRFLNAGADDYVTKPFSISELLARARALLRRPPTHSEPIIEINDLVVDTTRHSVAYVGETIVLTRKEFALLAHLMRNHGTIVTRKQLLENVWGTDSNTDSNTVCTHIASLRRKLKAKKVPPSIHTVRGVGYKYASAR